jgi:deazaflavin-dependent oxidoreductase (nitroreductase family)
VPNRTFLRIVTRVHKFSYRATAGRVGHRLGKIRVLLLTTTGRKSGRPWTTPLSYLSDGEDLVVIASYGGSDRHPAWYLNLVADPKATVEVGNRIMKVAARTAGPEERERLWTQAVEMYRGYEGYQRRTRRQIPLVILRRVDDSS